MTYLTFLLVFIVPPILLLGSAVLMRRALLPSRAGLFLALLPMIALVYTTPWDNYLVWRVVWIYGPARVMGTIGYVPIEEYLFFILQPLLAGLWLYLLLSHAAALPSGISGSRAIAVRRIGATLYLLGAISGAFLLRTERGTYLGLILAWALPVLAGQWFYAGFEIWRRRGYWLLGFTAPTLYLWVADAFAIRDGIWYIAERFTLGIEGGGLPLEEAVFFLVTNLLVVQGLILFLYPPPRRTDA